MSVPEYVPSSPTDTVRRMESEVPPLPARRPPLSHPAESVRRWPGRGRLQGRTGPDSGYALALAERFRGRLELGRNEDERDALTAGAVLGMARAALAGRGPILADVQVGLELLGYLGGAPEDLTGWRVRALQMTRSDRFRQLQLSGVDPGILALAPGEARVALGQWRTLLPADLVGVVPEPRTADSATVAALHPGGYDGDRLRRFVDELVADLAVVPERVPRESEAPAYR